MVRDEILTGLNNAVARGESLEKAAQSLILAGYNVQEIQEATKQVNMGVIGNIPEPSKSTSPQKASPDYKPLPTTAEKPSEKKAWLLAGLLGIVLLILIAIGVFILIK